MRGRAGKMGILAWNAEGEVCPFEGQHIFFRFPLSTPLPLDTASNYPRKEICVGNKPSGCACTDIWRLPRQPNVLCLVMSYSA